MTRSFVRRATYTLTVLTVLLPAGCRESTPPPEPPVGLTGQLGSASWTGDVYALLQPDGAGGEVLSLFASAPRGREFAPDHSIHIRVPFQGVGEYELGPDQVEFAILVGGDVLTAQYVGAAPDAGVLVIDEYHGPGSIIVGTVQFDAVLESGSPTYGQSVTFRDGRFLAMVYTQP